MNNLRESESISLQLPTNGPSVSPISCRITRSAISSCSVGSLLMITSRAPQFLAIIGKPAAGPHPQRRSDGDQQVAMLDELGGAAHFVFGHRLAERDGGGLDRLV